MGETRILATITDPRTGEEVDGAQMNVRVPLPWLDAVERAYLRWRGEHPGSKKADLIRRVFSAGMDSLGIDV